MSRLRSVLFWLHLSAGVVAGIVILIMSITGVALTYERQINEWTTSHLRSVAPSPAAVPLSVQEILTIVRRDHPDTRPTGITRANRADAPVTVAAEPETLYLDAYTGQPLGERGGAGIRKFLSDMRSWHRWLAVTGEGRASAKAITGWSNLLFLFIVVSGIYIWVPRVWTAVQLKSVLLFKRRYGTSKARDFNWHNVIGIWSAVPLFIVVISAVPISFPWASDLVYRAVGENPPPRNRPGGPGGPGGGPAGAREGGAARQGGSREAGVARQGGPNQDRTATEGRAQAAGGPQVGASGRGGRGNEGPRTPIAIDGLNALWARAVAEGSGWRTISMRFPRSDKDPIAFTIDRGDGGQPQLRSTLTLDRQSAAVVSRDVFSEQTLGRRIRSVMRFAHTGEVLGLPGQTIAGLVSAGGVVMVWTGLALTWRRFRSWVSRPRRVTQVDAPALDVGPESQTWAEVTPANASSRISARPQ